jgi:hypothetical protein
MLQVLKMSPALGSQKSDAELETMASEATERGTLLLYFGPAAALLSVIPILAGVFALLAMMAGTQIPYSKFLALLAHTFWAVTLASTAVLLTVVAVTPDPSAIDLQNAVQVNFGYFIQKFDHPVLFALGSSLDLFSLWHGALLALGISVFTEHKWSTRRSFSIPLVVWAAFVVGKTALVFAFSG